MRSRTREEVVAAVKALEGANVRGDLSGYSRLTGDEFTLVAGDGCSFTKQQTLRAASQKGTKARSVMNILNVHLFNDPYSVAVTTADYAADRQI